MGRHYRLLPKAPNYLRPVSCEILSGQQKHSDHAHIRCKDELSYYVRNSFRLQKRSRWLFELSENWSAYEAEIAKLKAYCNACMYVGSWTNGMPIVYVNLV